MSGIINRVPVGLLSALDMKSRGQAPRILASEAQLSIDGLELYLQNGRAILQSSTNAITAVGQYLAGIGSPTEYLWCRNFSIRSVGTLAAATTYRCRGYIAGTTNIPVYVTDQASGTTGERPIGNSGLAPFIIPPGWSYGVYCEAATLGTAAQWVCTIDYTILSV